MPTLIPATDSAGNLQVNINRLIAGEDQGANVLRTIPAGIVSATYSPTPYGSFGAATNGNVTNLPAQLKSLDVASLEASSLYYFQVWNGAAAGTGTLLYSWPLPVATATVPYLLERGVDFFTAAGVYCAAGISWGISSTNATYTAAGTAAKYNVHVNY